MISTNRKHGLTIYLLFLSYIIFIAASFITVERVSAANQAVDSDKEESVLMKVKVVSLEGCGGTPPTIDLIKKTANALNLQIELSQVLIKTPEDAVKHRHIGSPTVQINGLDIDPEARDLKQFGIT